MCLRTELRHDTLSRVVGRTAEVTHLEQRLETAMSGERQVVFVTGEPGIGKTTVIDTFLARLTTRADLRTGRGQCVEQYGAREAYLPLLEMAGRICRSPGGEQLIEVLRTYAPTWLLQLSFPLEAAERESLQRQLPGTTGERMLREAAEAMVMFTRDQGFVLIIEDLHWSDVATLEWLYYVAQQQEPARLLIIGTYRPADVFASQHPLKKIVQELQAHGKCDELHLATLSNAAVAEYLSMRFAGMALPIELPEIIHRRTGGNPLFMVNMVEHLTTQGVLTPEHEQWVCMDTPNAIEEGVPDTLRQLIEGQISRLSEEEQRLLEVASVAGAEFGVAVVAAGMDTTVDAVEEMCEALARNGQFIREHGVEEWPDGTVTGRYRFLHALYQNVLYDRMAVARRTRIHRRSSPHETESLQPSASTAERSPGYLFHKEGEYWTLVFNGTVCRVKHSRGIQYLAHLLSHPNEEFHALTLLGEEGKLDTETLPAPLISTHWPVHTGVQAELSTRILDAGEVLDPQARAAYKRRLDELRQELEEAQAFNDPERTDRLQSEVDFLTQELAQAIGLGGRARRVGSVAERARVGVTKAIKAALKRIQASHPALGQHLNRTIRTGTFCMYVADPHQPQPWQD